MHFKSVHASCGCTAAQTQKDEVPPGEKGEITATFNIGDRTGTQVKTVTVETDEAANQKTVLTLKADYPAATGDHPNFCVLETRRKAGPEDDYRKSGQGFYRETYQGHVIESGFSDQSGGSWRRASSKSTSNPRTRTRLLASTLTIQSGGFTKDILRHRADHDCSDCARCSGYSESSRCSRCSGCSDCPGSSDCSGWSNTLKFSLARQALILAAFALLPGVGRGDLFSRQDFVALANSAFGNGECRSGARSGVTLPSGSMLGRTMSSRAITFPVRFR